ncbi:uncharacterized protein LOC121986478 [Zingiber officinale]|uniref:Uncharacterized protein n=1 Tax=Zingiber officinale TaxID=94328 RepID=A0A8J5L2C9_ZINOF|nr:uncharacterized protein LOC121986478 [Zingiber officinale]KAG6502737.1 hypothetical protein ZIOFF_035024 [Zingiber officinale]
MGSCHSCDAAAAVAPANATTAIVVVLPDGGLREYQRPVTAGGVLGKDGVRFFLCDADDMEIEASAPEVRAAEELRLGQLYFVLPRAMLRRPLQAEDLAAMAVKASESLARRCGKGEEVAAPPALPAVETGGGKRRRGRGRGRSRFVPDLSAVPE